MSNKPNITTILSEKINQTYRRYLLLKSIYTLTTLYRHKYEKSKKVISDFVILNPVKSLLISSSIGFIFAQYFKKKRILKE